MLVRPFLGIVVLIQNSATISCVKQVEISIEKHFVFCLESRRVYLLGYFFSMLYRNGLFLVFQPYKDGMFVISRKDDTVIDSGGLKFHRFFFSFVLFL